MIHGFRTHISPPRWPGPPARCADLDDHGRPAGDRYGICSYPAAMGGDFFGDARTFSDNSIYRFPLSGRVELWENENQRFKYSDIQAILWRKTSESKITAVVFVVTTLLLVAGTVAPVPSILRISCAVCAVMSTGFVLRNALAGESCRCFVRTAVQTVNLASLTRVKQAEKVLEIVRPRIVAAQGKLAPEEIPSRMQEFHAVAGQSAGAGYVTDDPNAPPRIVA